VFGFHMPRQLRDRAVAAGAHAVFDAIAKPRVDAFAGSQLALGVLTRGALSRCVVFRELSLAPLVFERFLATVVSM
jgi:hypothetical protein